MYMPVQFQNYSIQVKEELEKASIAYLKEAAGEIQGQTMRNTRPIKYGRYDVKNNWEYDVNENKLEAKVGNKLQAALWEEFGTGKFALNKDGRKGWWVYVEGNDTPRPVQHHYTKEEAESVVAYLKSKGLDAHMTEGQPPNRPLFKSYSSLKNALIKRAENFMKEWMQ